MNVLSVDNDNLYSSMCVFKYILYYLYIIKLSHCDDKLEFMQYKFNYFPLGRVYEIKKVTYLVLAVILSPNLKSYSMNEYWQHDHKNEISI